MNPAAPGGGDARPIGIFDSGIGGLSVWREIVLQWPREATCYVADQAHIPYGPRSGDTLRSFAAGITEHLLAQDCKAIVVACNAASAAALADLRVRYPQVPFIGMEPAIKPAAAHTRSGVVGVLATPATLNGELFAATRARHGQNVRIIGEPCPGLVDLIEAGQAHGAALDALLREILRPALQAGADQLVLACTHYPFVIERIRHLAGAHVHVVDPAPAVARQLGRVLGERQALRPDAGAPEHRFATTGTPQRFTALLEALLGLQRSADSITALQWRDEAHLGIATSADSAGARI